MRWCDACEKRDSIPDHLSGNILQKGQMKTEVFFYFFLKGFFFFCIISGGKDPYKNGTGMSIYRNVLETEKETKKNGKGS